MASKRQIIEKRDNIAAIIAFVRSRMAVTRPEIRAGLSLSWACVSDLVAQLIGQGILLESKRGIGMADGVGRAPTYLSLNPEKYFLGVDINDIGISITVLGLDGKKIDYRKWDPEVFDDETGLRLSVCTKIKIMLNRRGECLGIGIAMQGGRLADHKWRYPVLYGYADVEVESVIEERFSLPVTLRHDPECMLYAVADKYSPDSMSLRVDNDIGVAAMKDGKVLDLPLDIGHIYICGKKLKNILNEAKASGDYSLIASRLGEAAANLAKLLGVKKVFVVGEIITWFDKVNELFDKSFKTVSSSIKYEVCDVEDASEGAARIAMTEYPQSWQCR